MSVPSRRGPDIRHLTRSRPRSAFSAGSPPSRPRSTSRRCPATRPPSSSSPRGRPATPTGPPPRPPPSPCGATSWASCGDGRKPRRPRLGQPHAHRADGRRSGRAGPDQPADRRAALPVAPHRAEPTSRTACASSTCAPAPSWPRWSPATSADSPPVEQVAVPRSRSRATSPRPRPRHGLALPAPRPS
jgi:hypothetical protein